MPYFKISLLTGGSCYVNILVYMRLVQ